MAVTDRELTREGGPALEDRHLAMAFKAGDASSYGVIHQRYRAEVEALCRRMLGNYHDAEEASQETFIRVYQALPRFNGQYRLRPWIRKIATNVCVDMLRARTRAKHLEGNGNGNGNGYANGNGNGNGHFPSTEEWAEFQASSNGHANGDLLDPLEILERRSEDGEVRAALATLPDHYRMALLMREYEGFSHEEIGTVLGMSTSQVKALLHRAKKSFRKVWIQAATRSYGLILPLFGLLRRFGRRAAEVSQPVTTGAAAGTQAAGTVVTSVAASPVTSSVVERVVGVIAAVTVTSAIGVGAVTVAHRHHAAPAKKPVVAAATAIPPSVAPAPASKAASKAPVVPPAKPKINGLPATPNVTLTPTPAPTGAAASPSSTQSTGSSDQGTSTGTSQTGTGGGPTPGPSGTPAPEPSPATVIPDPPAWSGAFEVSFLGGDLCVCDGLKQTSYTSSGQPGQEFHFTQELTGSATLADVPWTVDVNMAGSAIGFEQDGAVRITFTMTGPDGVSYSYVGNASMVPDGQADGIWGWALVGAWSGGGDLDQSGTIDHGRISAWTDGQRVLPVVSSVTLTESQ